LQVATSRYKVEMLKRKQTKQQDLAAEVPPGQYVYHPACHCSQCLEKRQATSAKLQAREDIIYEENEKLLDRSSKRQAASAKQQASSNKRLTK